MDPKTGQARPYLLPDGTPGAKKPKGYICPQNSVCVSGSNPYGGTVSFDDIIHSLELVFVVMTANTFSDLLYYTADSDYLVAALFFVAGIVILAFWLSNLVRSTYDVHFMERWLTGNRAVNCSNYVLVPGYSRGVKQKCILC